MMVVMDYRLVFTVYYQTLFIIICECWSELSPPRRVKVESSVFTWERPKDQSDITYAVQYNTTFTDWRDVYNGSQRQFNFTSTAEDFYGKRFRVRAERGTETSDWVMSKLVLCAYLDTCAPLIELKVEQDKVHVFMKHRDQSLQEKNGAHIMFRALYWKRDDADDKQEPETNSDHLVFEDLKSGQEYCFQVEYLLYHKPYGKPSQEICDVIPETSTERNLRIILIGVSLVIVLLLLGASLYFFYTRYKRIKQLLQPPLDIPDHIQEFFFNDVFQHTDDHPDSQLMESFDFVNIVEVTEDEERVEGDVVHNEENACSA